MTTIVRITVDVVTLNSDEKYEVDTEFEPEVVTVHYTDVEVGTVYEEASEIAECIKRIAAAG